MKKLAALLLSGVMMLSMAACSSSAGSKSGEESKFATDSGWPKKTIQIVCPFNPGGDADFNARSYAKRLEKILGKSVVVTNVNGNGGAVGNNQAKSASPDGYTVLFHTSAMFVNQAVEATDFGLEAFEVAGAVGKNAGNLVLVNASSKYKTLEDLVKASKENPGKVSFAANQGATTQVMATQLNEAGAALNIVDLGGGSERVAALMGGHVDAIVSTIGAALPYLEAGNFRALCILEDERNELIKDVPTAKELGYDATFTTYYLFAFPKGTPQDIVNSFANACEEVSKMEDYQKEIKTTYLQDPFFEKGDEGLSILKKQQDMVLSLKDKLLGK